MFHSFQNNFHSTYNFMGNPFAPSLANLFMTKFEEQHILNPDENPFYQNILVFRRFLDGIFLLFQNQNIVYDF